MQIRLILEFAEKRKSELSFALVLKVQKIESVFSFHVAQTQVWADVVKINLCQHVMKIPIPGISAKIPAFITVQNLVFLKKIICS